MTDYYDDLGRAKKLGLEHAQACIANGQTVADQYPLNGEFTDGMTPRDVFTALGASFEKADDFEITDVCDNWEDGYLSAPWPVITMGDDPHVGHTMPLTGAWYCDTCQSPLCDLV